jgi:ketosteroid isomerase-like protein
VTIEDHEAIRELLARYCHYVDAADTERWVGLYVEEGALAMNMGAPPIEGTEALRSFASARRPGIGLHLSANPIIAVDGEEARVESYVVVIAGNDDPQVRLAGRYEDRLRRVDGSWKFVRRELHPELRKRS